MARVNGHDYAETIDAADGVTNESDTIYGLGGIDTIFGLGGNDRIKGGGGADTINGGDGLDTAMYDDSPIGVYVTLETNRGFNGTAEGDRLISIENLSGSSHDDLLVGNSAGNTLEGLDGQDTLKGGGGDDRLHGGAGNDTLNGGPGNDRLYGDAGNDIMIGGLDSDTYYVDSAGDTITELAGQGEDLVHAATTYALAADAEIEFLGPEDVTLTTPMDFSGNGFGQVLDGNSGDNRLYGRGGADYLQGNYGDDVLDGGAGADTLYGYVGDDTFVFVIGEANGDTVSDFSGNGAAVGDSLQFVGYGADASFTQVDDTHWQVNFHGGTEHEVITFLNGGGASIHPSDVMFF